jgi:uncharacterized protein YceK
MKLFILVALCAAVLSGCATIQKADEQAGKSYRTQVIADAFVDINRDVGNNAVRLAAVEAAQKVTVSSSPAKKKSSCPDLVEKEADFKKNCTDHTEGSGDINEDREEVCGHLRSALDKLLATCDQDPDPEQTEVVFTPNEPPAAGVHINLTGASTGDIRFIIQSAGAADQSSNGKPPVQATAPPPSVITGMTNGLLDLLGKATPWVAGGYAMGNVADAFADGMRNAGDRDNSVDQSVSTDNSIGGDKISTPVEEPVAELVEE